MERPKKYFHHRPAEAGHPRQPFDRLRVNGGGWEGLSLELPANHEPRAIFSLFSGYRPPDFARAGLRRYDDVDGF